MAKLKAPDPNAALNESTFKLPNAPAYEGALSDNRDATSAIKYDWSGTNAALGGLDAAAGRIQDRATEGNTTADYWAQRQNAQQNVAVSASDPAALGKALMLQAQRASLNAAGVAQAGSNQQQQFAAQAQQLQMSAYKTRMQMQKQALDLAVQKQAALQNIVQVRTGLELAQLQLKNMYASGLAGAKNNIQAINNNANAQNLANIMGYVNMGLGAASAGFAAASGAAGPTGATPPAQPSLAAYAAPTARMGG